MTWEHRQQRSQIARNAVSSELRRIGWEVHDFGYEHWDPNVASALKRANPRTLLCWVPDLLVCSERTGQHVWGVEVKCASGVSSVVNVEADSVRAAQAVERHLMLNVAFAVWNEAESVVLACRPDEITLYDIRPGTSNGSGTPYVVKYLSQLKPVKDVLPDLDWIEGFA